MNAAPRVLIVIPVYNHGLTLRTVVERALDVHPNVLVVDDGSTDAGPATLGGLPVQVTSHERNRGKGAAIMTGAALATKQGFTHIVTLDADTQHFPEDFPRFLPVIRDHPTAIIVGARDFDIPTCLAPRASVGASPTFGCECRLAGRSPMCSRVSVRILWRSYRPYPLARRAIPSK